MAGLPRPTSAAPSLSLGRSGGLGGVGPGLDADDALLLSALGGARGQPSRFAPAPAAPASSTSHVTVGAAAGQALQRELAAQLAANQAERAGGASAARPRADDRPPSGLSSRAAFSVASDAPARQASAPDPGGGK